GEEVGAMVDTAAADHAEDRLLGAVLELARRPPGTEISARERAAGDDPAAGERGRRHSTCGDVLWRTSRVRNERAAIEPVEIAPALHALVLVVLPADD